MTNSELSVPIISSSAGLRNIATHPEFEHNLIVLLVAGIGRALLSLSVSILATNALNEPTNLLEFVLRRVGKDLFQVFGHINQAGNVPVYIPGEKIWAQYRPKGNCHYRVRKSDEMTEWTGISQFGLLDDNKSGTDWRKKNA